IRCCATCLLPYLTFLPPAPQLLSFFFFSCSRDHRDLHSFPTRRSSDLDFLDRLVQSRLVVRHVHGDRRGTARHDAEHVARSLVRSEEHTSELQSPYDLVCRLLLEKKKKKTNNTQ